MTFRVILGALLGFAAPSPKLKLAVPPLALAFFLPPRPMGRAEGGRVQMANDPLQECAANCYDSGVPLPAGSQNAKQRRRHTNRY